MEGRKRRIAPLTDRELLYRAFRTRFPKVAAMFPRATRRILHHGRGCNCRVAADGTFIMEGERYTRRQLERIVRSAAR